jgi:hypothetical protein
MQEYWKLTLISVQKACLTHTNHHLSTTLSHEWACATHSIADMMKAMWAKSIMLASILFSYTQGHD